MTSHFSVPSFFRKVPNALLKRYFDGRGGLSDLDFSTLPQSRPQVLMDAWRALPADVRGAMEVDFSEIFDVASEKGFAAILAHARQQFRDYPAKYTSFNEMLATLDGHPSRAMVVFLDHNSLWAGATRLSYADSLPYWRKRRGLPTRPAASDAASLAALQSAIGRWFHENEGRGLHCLIEPLERDGRILYFVYLEDYSDRKPEWVEGELQPRPRNPAFEVMFVWSAAEGVLELHHRGTRSAVEPLQSLFAQHMLGLEKLPPNLKDMRIYDLNPLKRRDFQFLCPPASGIESVRVRKLRLTSTVRKGDRLTLEADVWENEGALHALLNQAGRAFPMGLWNVTWAEISAQLVPRDGKPSRRETFTVSFPNACSLGQDDVAMRLRTMLTASGIEAR